MMLEEPLRGSLYHLGTFNLSLSIRMVTLYVEKKLQQDWATTYQD